ncbi:MAG TPA: VWA domain-containing protein [Thermoanaerobaculia bacterium]|nr:VWA domain-containing protein [Thermoanaerobaculia bacterium]
MRRSSRIWRSGVLAAGLSVCLVLGAAALTAQTFTESTQVVVVEVPVQVVRDGEPVKGLTAADFEVFDGRKKVPITGFEVLDLTTTTTAAAPQAGQEPVPVTARRHFLVLFDLSFSDPKAIFQARKAAHDMVQTLHPTDLVAVATYGNRGPQIALGFTADRRQIAAAIDTLGLPELADRTPDPLRLLVADVKTLEDRPQGIPDMKDPKAAKQEAVIENMEKLYSESKRADESAQKARIAAFTQSVAALARMMDAVDGRKYVVLLSEGFDASLIQGSQNVEEQMEQSAEAASGVLENVDSSARFGDTKALNQVEKMIEEFRRADCVVQAVDIGGLRAAGTVEGSSQGRGGKDSLLQIAKGTGGELFENTNNLAGAMKEVLKRTSVTYVLAFQPDSLKWDGNYHRLKVEVKNQPRGTRLVHRPGYYAPKPYTAQNPMEKMMDAASQMVSGEESGTVKMSVLAAPFKVAGDKAYVPVVLEVDGQSLLANSQGATLPAEIYIYAMDEGGAVHDFVAQTLGLDVTKAGAQLRQTGLKFFGHVDLYPGDYSIRVMVRNGATGASSLRVVPVRVPAFAEAGPFLLPPFFPEAPGKWLMAREAPREGQTQNVDYPFMQDKQPYIPASKPVLTPGQEAPLSLVAYNLGSGDIKAQAKVLSLDGKELGAGDLKLLGSEAGSPSRLKASFRPPALQPGEYRLRVTLVDPSGATHSSTTAFSVGGGGKAAR